MKEKSITLNDSLKDIINLHILKAFKKKKNPFQTNIHHAK